jgi:hypothetical protein
MMGSVTAFSLQPVAGDGVETHQPKKYHPKGEVDQISHGDAPPNGSRWFLRQKHVSGPFAMKRRDIRIV